MPIYINRVLNMKNIKVIGFDMDYTLVRYNAEAFEGVTHRLAAARLAELPDYPDEVKDLEFDYQRAIVGLVIDFRNGNLLQVSRHGKVKIAFHGLEPLDYHRQQKIYRETAIDLRDPNFQSLDTSFAISYGVLFSQLVQMKTDGADLPGYQQIADDVNHAIDLLHQDDSIKSVLRENFDAYVIKDSKVAGMLERYKDYGKKLMIITNSDYAYTKALLDYALNPFLKKHKNWQELFDIVITFAEKPRFFEQSSRFLRIDPETETMTNHMEKITDGIYQGGNFAKLERDLGYSGSEILYLGDHIYGDVVTIKKFCSWRTALVLGDLDGEIKGIRESRELQEEINRLMGEKLKLEKEINFLDSRRYEGENITHKQLTPLFDSMDELNGKISELLGQYKAYFNPYWGEILRAGFDESRYAEQVEKYACIYMTKVSDLYNYSPKTYFRPYRRIMPHEDLSSLD